VRLAADGRHGVGDRVPARTVTQRAVGDGEDDGGGVAGLGREPVGEEVVRALGLRARRREVVGEAGARARQHAEDREHGDEDEGGALPMMGGGAGEAPEEEGHASCYRTQTANLQLLHICTVC
jgi:hypothetical protein